MVPKSRFEKSSASAVPSRRSHVLSWYRGIERWEELDGSWIDFAQKGPTRQDAQASAQKRATTTPQRVNDANHATDNPLELSNRFGTEQIRWNDR
jgi:hypothetical protein